MSNTELEGLGDAAAIIESTSELTLAAGQLTLVDEQLPNVYVHTLPRGDGSWAVDIQDLDAYAERPRRKSGRVKVVNSESLAAYVNMHATEGTTLYADADSFAVNAVLDDHEKAKPSHREHRVLLELRKTPGCVRWIGTHGKYLGQEEFAQLIEDGLTEIARPDGATLLEVAQSIHATKSATFRSDKRLTTGRVQFNWVEELNASAGADGTLEIPETVTLVFEPFYGAAPVQIDARFRYRIRDGKLALGFWLIRHEETLREAFDAELARLKGLLDIHTLIVWGAGA